MLLQFPKKTRKLKKSLLTQKINLRRLNKTKRKTKRRIKRRRIKVLQILWRMIRNSKHMKRKINQKLSQS
jgi:hypothetical protein